VRLAVLSAIDGLLSSQWHGLGLRSGGQRGEGHSGEPSLTCCLDLRSHYTATYLSCGAGHAFAMLYYAQMRADRDAIQLDESRNDRDARIAATDGNAIEPPDPSEIIASVVRESPTTTGKGGASRRVRADLKRGTKICSQCHIELKHCPHKPKRGRPKLAEPKSEWLRVYLPHSFIAFLKRSSLQLSDVLEAVLGSKAMKCWHSHIYVAHESTSILGFQFEKHERMDREADGSFIMDPLGIVRLPTRRELLRGYMTKDDSWKDRVGGTIGPKFSERVTPALKARVRHFGATVDNGQKHSVSLFCTYCIAYYYRLLAKSPEHPKTISWDWSSSKQQAYLIRALAQGCEVEGCASSAFDRRAETQ